MEAMALKGLKEDLMVVRLHLARIGAEKVLELDRSERLGMNHLRAWVHPALSK